MKKAFENNPAAIYQYYYGNYNMANQMGGNNMDGNYQQRNVPRHPYQTYPGNSQFESSSNHMGNAISMQYNPSNMNSIYQNNPSNYPSKNVLSEPPSHLNSKSMHQSIYQHSSL